MDLRHLRYFVAVAEELSFTRAAARLHIAQPPLSVQIRLLEEDLQVMLFVRDRRAVFLTQAGRALLESARGVLAAVEQAKTGARDAAAGAAGRVALGYTASAMFTERLPAVIRHYRQKRPKVELSLAEMTSLDQLDALHASRLDIAILRKPSVPLPKGIVIEPWYHAPLVAAVPAAHPLAKRRTIRISDLEGEPLITFPRDAGIGLYWPLLQLFSRSGLRPRVVREAREPAVMIGLVSAGSGIAVVPSDTRCIRLRGVAYVALADADAVSTLSVARRTRPSGADDEPVMALLSLLRSAKRLTGEHGAPTRPDP